MISSTVQFIADWVADMPPIGSHRLDARMISDTFRAAARRRFSPTSDIREISSFVIDYRLRYPDEAPAVPVREGQALIRVMLGEPTLRRYVDKSIEVQAILPLTIWILRDLAMPPDELIAFLLDNENQAKD